MSSTLTDRIDGVTTSTAIKAPCRVATTANITLSGEQTIDGIAVVDGDRVLVKDQDTQTENGIYVASTGGWSRALDFDGNRDVRKGTQVLVNSGTVGGAAQFICTATDPIVIDTTNITWTTLELLLDAAPVNSPTFTGVPAAPTAAPGTNTTQIATTGFVQAALTALLNGVSASFDTLAELAAGLALKVNLAGNQNLTGGFTTTSYSAGTKSSGTFTLDALNGNIQHATNNGAHTLAPPTAPCTIILEYTNGASAGAITTSGFTEVSGESFTTTNTHKFICSVVKTNSWSALHVRALQ
jgi:hypothetical protein